MTERRMRRISTCWLVLGCLLVATTGMVSEAAADERERTALMEFKLGPVHPMVDQEFDNGPYQSFFGGDSMLYGEFELDYHLWQGFGTLSLGLHGGYGRVSGVMRDQEGQEVDTDDRSALRNIPVKGSLVYRYDYSAHNHNIPLVPVGKAGLNYNFWRVTNARGNTMEVDDQRAVGGRAGWHATLGLHLHLDFIDPSSAAAFDMSWGIANSFLFAEYTWHRVGFGTAGIDLSSNHWAAGLAFEF